MRSAAVTEHGHRSRAVIGALTLSLAVTACGGGGGGLPIFAFMKAKIGA